MPRVKDSARPRLSSEARKALDEIWLHKTRIEVELENLSETDLRAVMLEMRRSIEGAHQHLALGAVADAERKLGILERHRTGRGKWFAVVESLEWETDDGIGLQSLLAKTECETKSDAEAEARKLLAKHASEFSDHTEIEAKVLCELEIDNYYAKDPIP